MDLLIAYSKHLDLCEELGKAVRTLEYQTECKVSVPRSVSNGHAPRSWRVRDRLTAEDIDQLVRRYREGVTGRKLAQEYKLGLTTVKNLLRKYDTTSHAQEIK